MDLRALPFLLLLAAAFCSAQEEVAPGQGQDDQDQQQAVQVSATEAPKKYAPRYCLRLRFNCEAQAGHVCCRFPLPPSDGSERSSYLRPSSIKIRPMRMPSMKSGDKQQQKPTSKPEVKEEKESSPMEESSNMMKKLKQQQQQQHNSVSSSSSYQKRKPSGLLSRMRGKKPKLCLRLVVNCKSNPGNRCCQYEEKEEDKIEEAPKEEVKTSEPKEESNEQTQALAAAPNAATEKEQAVEGEEKKATVLKPEPAPVENKPQKQSFQQKKPQRMSFLAMLKKRQRPPLRFNRPQRRKVQTAEKKTTTTVRTTQATVTTRPTTRLPTTRPPTKRQTTRSPIKRMTTGPTATRPQTISSTTRPPTKITTTRPPMTTTTTRPSVTKTTEATTTTTVPTITTTRPPTTTTAAITTATRPTTKTTKIAFTAAPTVAEQQEDSTEEVPIPTPGWVSSVESVSPFGSGVKHTKVTVSAGLGASPSLLKEKPPPSEQKQQNLLKKEHIDPISNFTPQIVEPVAQPSTSVHHKIPAECFTLDSLDCGTPGGQNVQHMCCQYLY